MPLGDSGINPGLAASDPAMLLQDAVRRGESFSGNERHVAFRNSAGSGFADVSGVTGLDLPDDGRAACFTDWDGDGDLDLWVNNRSGPQLRFFQNDNPSGGRGLTVKLVGVTCNRDAVGARAVLHLKGGAKQSRSVIAGSGFLAQSSKTLHFGCGDTEGEKLVIHWPGEESQMVALSGHGSYLVVQGKPPVDFAPGEPGQLERTEFAPPTDRTFLAQRLPVATVFPRPAAAVGKPLLVVLTSDTCQNCEAQLAEWASRPPPGVALHTTSIEALRAAEPGRLRSIQVAHDHLFDVNDRPMPTPLSFLISADDHLCAIYRGRIDADVLRGDIANLSSQGEALRAASLPFAGRWVSGSPPRVRPLSFVEDLLDAGLLDAAERYMKHYQAELQRDELFPALVGRLRTLRSGNR